MVTMASSSAHSGSGRDDFSAVLPSEVAEPKLAAVGAAVVVGGEGGDCSRGSGGGGGELGQPGVCG